MLDRLRDGKSLSRRQQISLIVKLSLPAVIAQLSYVIQEFVDAAMVGHLGSKEAASIALVVSSTWLAWAIIEALAVGFSIQMAQAVGAKEYEKARSLVRQGLMVSLLAGLLILVVGVFIAGPLPGWIGGEQAIRADATDYFFIIMMGMPIFSLGTMAGGIIQASGKMKIPSIVNIIASFLNVIFNGVLIFPSGTKTVAGFSFWLPGFGLGVRGAALATLLADSLAYLFMIYYLAIMDESLRLRKGEHLSFTGGMLKRAIRLAVPSGFEKVGQTLAQIMSTWIVSPLGAASLASHSFAISIEGICYMPGIGIGIAATTIIGQSIGAKRRDLTKSLTLAILTIGIGVMGIMGALMYIFAPQLIGMVSPDTAIQELGSGVMRIVAFVEPLYGAAIVGAGILRGLGSTLIPGIINIISMWVVRIPLAITFAGIWGIRGVWIAMSIDLAIRGIIMLIMALRGSVKVTITPSLES